MHEQIASIVNGGFDALIEIISTKNLSKIIKNKFNESKDLAPTDKFNNILDIAQTLIDEVTNLTENKNVLCQEIKILKETENEYKQKLSALGEDIQNLLTGIGDYKTSK